VLTKLRKLGCQLAIDDYGTGSSSLGYLRDLPVTELKLDRSFLADALTDDRARSIVRSTIGLAHELGLRIVAEGVENEATLSLLESLGCDAAQGFHIGRAVPASEIARALLPAPPTPPWRAAPLGHRPPARRLHTELRTVS
jgi:EAL domain-containing protein (putative c-di-GMP-specific phosphodiesterase class I)